MSEDNNIKDQTSASVKALNAFIESSMTDNHKDAASSNEEFVLIPADCIPAFVEKNLENRHASELVRLADLITEEYQRVMKNNLHFTDFEVNAGPLTAKTRKALMGLHFTFKPLVTENIIQLPFNYAKEIRWNQMYGTRNLHNYDAYLMAQRIECSFDNSHEGYLTALTHLIGRALKKQHYPYDLHVVWPYAIPESVADYLSDTMHYKVFSLVQGNVTNTHIQQYHK